MSFPIIKKLGGEEKAIAILKASDLSASSDSIRMWKGRGMPAHAELAFTKEAIELGIEYAPSDFIYEPDQHKDAA